jgi:regulator of replication initiation timing
MNATETLNRVLATLGLKPEATIEVDLAQVKTEDGQATFESDNFAVGEAVFIVTPDGNIPTPEGEFALENGNTMTVDANGTIVEIATKEEEAPEEEAIVEEVVAEDMPMEEPMKAMPMAKRVVKSKTEMEESYFSKQMSELEAKFEARLSALEGEKIALSVENKELTERLSTEPAPHTLHNPESNGQAKKLQFHMGNKREESIKDRVFNQLFN